MTHIVSRFYPSLLFFFSLPAMLTAQSSGFLSSPTAPAHPVEAGTSSSVAELPEAPVAAVYGRRMERSGMNVEYQTHMYAFSRVAMAWKAGSEGIGIDVATPLSNKWNLRAGFSMLTGRYHFTVSGVGDLSNGLQPLKDGISVEAEPHFHSVSTSLDWFPRYGNFRISPGLTLYNGNHGSALATVKGGQVLSLGDGDYTSDPRNPILATIKMGFGHKVAPRLTIGWGNMLPREGAHFSFPFEIGVEYIGQPKINLTLSGNDCDFEGDCGPIANDPSTLQNLRQEQSDLNDNVSFLRLYPIISSGVAYRF